MNEFCTNCGNEIAEGAVVCTNCGQPVAAAQSTGFDIKKYLPIGIGAVAVILVIILAVSLFGGGYKKPLDYRIQMLNGNFDNLEKMAPPEYWEYYEDEYDEDIDDIKESLEENYEDYVLDYYEEEYGDNVKFSVSNVKKDKLSEKKLDNIRDGLKDNYGIAKKSVTEAYELEFDTKIKGDDDEEEDEGELIVAKIGGKWYACSEDGDIDLL